MNYFTICVIIGVILFIFVRLILLTGGTPGSQYFRDRMTSAGSDLQNKRLRDLGLEPEKNKE
ncbi:MAG: hypothetical protein E7193_03705 [Erysipelotrichaceae bacterium]|nr:hypothetical protein [Erysipelotrichaceae bacterium]